MSKINIIPDKSWAEVQWLDAMDDYQNHLKNLAKKNLTTCAKLEAFVRNNQMVEAIAQLFIMEKELALMEILPRPNMAQADSYRPLTVDKFSEFHSSNVINRILNYLHIIENSLSGNGCITNLDIALIAKIIHQKQYPSRKEKVFLYENVVHPPFESFGLRATISQIPSSDCEAAVLATSRLLSIIGYKINLSSDKFQEIQQLHSESIFSKRLANNKLPPSLPKNQGVETKLPISVTAGAGNSFNQINIGSRTKISFHRTLRVPEDGKDYPLPAGLGVLPIHRVEDYANTVPTDWLKEGGFFIPLYQKEALFLQFEGLSWHPTIAKVCVGKINAISGKAYSERLSNSAQDYVVIPPQKWLDGIASGKGTVSQFVAMPLGQGYTIEAQITDEEKFGGFQIVAYEAVEGRFPNRDPAVDKRIQAQEQERLRIKKQTESLKASPRQESSTTIRLASAAPMGQAGAGASLYSAPQVVSMGIAAGGSIKQQIQKDTYGVESWSPNKKRSLTIHLVNSMAYKAITGIDPPSSPITAATYEHAKIPWFSHYDETVPAVKPPSVFKRILGISAIEKKRGITRPEDEVQRSIVIRNIHTIRTPDKHEASSNFRGRAYESRSKEWWEAAIREISYVIDLQTDAGADDFALRSCCNYHLGRYRDGAIDGSLALEKDNRCVEALSWRAYCRKSLGDHEGLRDDADELIKIPATELVGLELRAEASLLSGSYNDAIYDALSLKKKNPGHPRAEQILSEARNKAHQQFREK
jgi:hypothetical protein